VSQTGCYAPLVYDRAIWDFFQVFRFKCTERCTKWNKTQNWVRISCTPFSTLHRFLLSELRDVKTQKLNLASVIYKLHNKFKKNLKTWLFRFLSFFPKTRFFLSRFFWLGSGNPGSFRPFSIPALWWWWRW